MSSAILDNINFSEYEDEYYKNVKRVKEDSKCKFMEKSFNAISQKYMAWQLKKLEEKKAKKEEKLFSASVTPKQLKNGKADKKLLKLSKKLAKVEGEIFFLTFGGEFTPNYLQHRALKISEALKGNMVYNRNHEYSLDPEKLPQLKEEIEAPWKTAEEVQASEILKNTTESIAKEVQSIAVENEENKEASTRINKNGTAKAKTEKFNNQDSTYHMKGSDMKPEYQFTVVSPESIQEEQKQEDTTYHMKGSELDDEMRYTTVSPKTSEEPQAKAEDSTYALKKEEIDPEFRVTKVSPTVVEDTTKPVSTYEVGFQNNDIFGKTQETVVAPKEETATREMPIVAEERKEEKDLHFDLDNATEKDLKNAVEKTTDISQLQEYLVKAEQLKREKENARAEAEAQKKEAEAAKESLKAATEQLEQYTKSLAEEKEAIKKEASEYSARKAEYDAAMAQIFATIETGATKGKTETASQGKGK